MPVRLDDVRLLARVADREGLTDRLGPFWRRCPEPFSSLAPATSAAPSDHGWIWPVIAHLADRTPADPECSEALAVLAKLLQPAIVEVVSQRAVRGLPDTTGVISIIADITKSATYAIYGVHSLIAERRPADVNAAIARHMSDGTLAASRLIEPEDIPGLAWLAPTPSQPTNLTVATIGSEGHRGVERRQPWPSGRPYLAELQDATLEAHFLLHVGEGRALTAGVSYRARFGLPFRSVLLSPKHSVAVHAPLGGDIPVIEHATYFGRPSEHGHFIIEGLERLHAHDRAESPPSPPILVQSLPRAGYRRILAGLGLPADDDDYVVVPDNRVRVRRLSIAGIGTQLPVVDEATVRHLGELGRRAAGVPAGRNGAGRRLHLARRRSGRRNIVNEAEVRAALEARGYETVYMEDLDLADQIALIAKASEIVGVHGSQLINAIWARPDTRVGVLVPSTWRTWDPGHVDLLVGLLRAAGLDASLVECDLENADERVMQQFHADLIVPLAGLRRWMGSPRHG